MLLRMNCCSSRETSCSTRLVFMMSTVSISPRAVSSFTKSSALPGSMPFRASSATSSLTSITQSLRLA